MYKLYSNVRGPKLLDESTDENDILDTLGTYIGILENIDYIVIDDSLGYDYTKEVILSVDDYVKYKTKLDSEYKLKKKRRCK